MRTHLALRRGLALTLCLAAAGAGLATPAAAAARATAPADAVVLSIFGEPGDPITGGTPHVWRSGADSVRVTWSGDGLRITTQNPGGERFVFDLIPPAGEPMTVGTHHDPTARPTPGRAVLNVTGGDRSCTAGQSGRFEVLDFAAETDRFWALFEQRCAGAGGSYFGEIRINARPTRGPLIAPSRLQFPARAFGSGALSVPITVVNTATEPLAFGTPMIEGRPAKSTASRLGDDDIGIAGTVSFAVRESTCAAVPAGESCTVWVTYSPLFPGPVEAYLVLPDPNTGERYRSSLAGFVD
ncbi:hypothetical protein [Sporichthya polymorpha]|uniref:hypothetical protein n=1 Tax=Sporichthya polymorpha TaxID=35751 RepID=UPI00036D9F96|nr:hypothetical protein [Sporichthya polymorpha]